MQVTFILSDKTCVTVNESVLHKSRVFSDMLSCGENSNEPIPLNLSSRVFYKVLEFLEYYKGGNDSDMSFDEIFIDSIEINLLTEVIVAADFLDIQDLLELVCKKAGSLILGKNPRENPQPLLVLGISNELSERENITMDKEFKYLSHFG
jgi:hypothetical protein